VERRRSSGKARVIYTLGECSAVIIYNALTQVKPLYRSGRPRHYPTPTCERRRQSRYSIRVDRVVLPHPECYTVSLVWVFYKRALAGSLSLQLAIRWKACLPARGRVRLAIRRRHCFMSDHSGK